MRRLMTLLITTGATLGAMTGCRSGSGAASGMAGNIALDTALTAAQKEARVFSPEVMWKMGRIASGGVSADGREVLYALTYYNMAENKGYTSLYIMPLREPEKARAITNNAGKDNSPVWGIDLSAGGVPCVYFLSSRGTDSKGEVSQQLWTVLPDGTGMRQLSTVDGGITGFGVAPKGDKVWYTAEVKVDSVSSADIYGLKDSKALIYDDLMERHWDQWEDGSYSHIFVAELDAAAGVLANAHDIMPGEPWDAPTAPNFDMGEVAWNGTGTALAYTCKKLTGYEYSMSTNSDIYLYTLSDGSTKNLTEGMPGYDKYPVFSPDDSRLAWQSMERARNESDKDRLFVMDLATGTKTYATKGFDYNASNLRWTADGQSVYFIAPIEATHQICRADLSPAGGTITVLTAGDHDYTGFSVAFPNAVQAGSSAACGTGLDEAVMVAEKTTISMAPELFTVNVKDGKDAQVTFINREIYANVDMGDVRKRWVGTTDGKRMLTWVIVPPHFDSTKQYPTLLYCQGGPQSVVSQRWSYRWNFQLMAAQGYVVVAPNRRGLPSFGQEWLDQISGDYSGQNIRDYLSAIDDVSRESWIDTSRRACVGASYGGYSTFYLAGHSGRRFKAFIAHCGMFNLESFYGETEELWFPNNDLGGAYWERPGNKVADRSYANSPHLAVNDWYAPILIVTGAKDFRIPFTQSLQAFTAARAHGIPSRLVYFEDEGHQVFKPQNALVWHGEFFGWLDKYLK